MFLYTTCFSNMPLATIEFELLQTASHSSLDTPWDHWPEFFNVSWGFKRKYLLSIGCWNHAKAIKVLILHLLKGRLLCISWKGSPHGSKKHFGNSLMYTTSNSTRILMHWSPQELNHCIFCFSKLVFFKIC